MILQIVALAECPIPPMTQTSVAGHHPEDTIVEIEGKSIPVPMPVVATMTLRDYACCLSTMSTFVSDEISQW